MRISDWSSDVCSSDLQPQGAEGQQVRITGAGAHQIDFTRCIRRLTCNLFTQQALGLGALPGQLPVSDRPLEHLFPERSEERRVGKECVSTCRSRWSPYH